jgi:hypothetical protein
MYHFDNGYHAEIEQNSTTEYVVHVTGNNTDVRVVHLTMAEAADVLNRLRNQHPSK